jgi:hypothetical protein
MGTVSATPAALDLIAEIIVDHGPVMFHQSGGCCDGSSPMCYPKGEFLIGDYDVKMGEIGGAPFYRDRRRARPRRHVLSRQRPREALPRPLGHVRDPGGRKGVSRRPLERDSLKRNRIRS